MRCQSMILVSSLLLWMSTIVSSQYNYGQHLARGWSDRPSHGERDTFDGQYRNGFGLLDSFSTHELVTEVEQRLSRRGLPAISKATLMGYVKRGTTWITKMTAQDTSRLAKFLAKTKTLTPEKRMMRKELVDKEHAAGKAAEPQLKVKLAALAANKNAPPKLKGAK